MLYYTMEVRYVKKAYTLDYSIERDIDRLEAVKQILDTLPTNPPPSDLEQMANYILYGKDENGKNAVERHETTDNNKRFDTFKKREDRNESLDALLESPLTDQTAMRSLDDEKLRYVHKKPSIHRPKYDKKTGELIDPGDSDVPGIQELWERIDYLECVIAANEGRIPMRDEYSVIRDSYQLWKLKHQVVDMRRHQYYLKDSWRPTIHLLGVTPPQPQFYNWDTDCYYWISLTEWQNRIDKRLLHTISPNLEDYETRTAPDGTIEVKWMVRQHHFDWENPEHIRALIQYYSAIYMQLWDKVYSWGRTLIFDFDRYQDLARLSEVRQFMLTRRIDGATSNTIMNEVHEKFGLKYTENHVTTILNKEIPEKIAAAAKLQRVLRDTPLEERKRCFHCGRWLPRTTMFFGKNRGRRDGWSSNCKECERQRRIEKGEQALYDRRVKDTALLEMPPRKT